MLLTPQAATTAENGGGSRGNSANRRILEIPQCVKHFKEEKQAPLETGTAIYRPLGRISEGAFGLTFLAVIESTKRQAHFDMTGSAASSCEPLSPTSEQEQRQIWSLHEGKKVVIKEIKKHESGSQNAESLQLHGRNLESMDIVKSISHISNCQHPFIAKLLDSQYALTFHDTPFEVYEYYAVGDAMNFLDHITDSDEKHKEATNLQSYIIYLSLQVTEGLSFLHDSGYIHFDLKIDNVFIDEVGDAKLGDFGLARACTLKRSIENPYYYWGGCCPFKIFSSIRWVPPEQLSEDCVQVDHSVDWYSLGALMFHMIYHRLPFEEHRKKVLDSRGEDSERQLKRKFLKIWKANPRPKVDDRPKVNQKLKNLIYNLLSFDSASRMGKSGCADVFQRFHSLCKDLDLRWLDGVNPNDTERIRRLIRKREIARPYRIKLIT